MVECLLRLVPVAQLYGTLGLNSSKTKAIEQHIHHWWHLRFTFLAGTEQMQGLKIFRETLLSI